MSRSTWTDHAWELLHEAPQPPALHMALDEVLLDEVAALAARGLAPNLPAMKAVGYRELAAALAGEVSLSAGLENAQRETRRYAKRQATWLRGQMADWPRIDAVAHEDQWRQFIALTPALTG